MRCGAGPLAVVAAVFWTQCFLLHGVDAKKERKRPKEVTPQQTETFNATMSNSEEVGGSVKVNLNINLIFQRVAYLLHSITFFIMMKLHKCLESSCRNVRYVQISCQHRQYARQINDGKGRKLWTDRCALPGQASDS